MWSDYDVDIDDADADDDDVDDDDDDGDDDGRPKKLCSPAPGETDCKSWMKRHERRTHSHLLNLLSGDEVGRMQ